MARKQSELKGMETPSAIPEVDAAAERLRAASKRRKNAQDAEVEAKALLMRLMKDNKLAIYEDHDSNPPLVVTIGITEKVTVEELREGGSEPEDGVEAEGDEPEEDGPKAPTKPLKQRASKKEAPAEA